MRSESGRARPPLQPLEAVVISEVGVEEDGALADPAVGEEGEQATPAALAPAEEQEGEGAEGGVEEDATWTAPAVVEAQEQQVAPAVVAAAEGYKGSSQPAALGDDAMAKTAVRFGPQRVAGQTRDTAKSADVADLDGDGLLDIVYAAMNDDMVFWFRNLGGGVFEEEPRNVTAYNETYGPAWVMAVDLVGSKLPDVLVASNDDNMISVYPNLGGKFGERRVITQDADGASSVFIADMDGDGKPDVLSSSQRNNLIAWYANDGGDNGGFSNQMKVAEDAWGATSVFAADIDGDGGTDILSAGPGDSMVAWYKYDDTSQTWIKHEISSVLGVYSVYAADINFGGRADVLVCSPVEGKVLLFKNTVGPDQSVSFEKTVLTADAPGAVYASIGDVDSDGDLDIVVASMFSNRVSWFENLGNLTFSYEHVISSVAKGAAWVTVADVNADGDVDVVSAHLADGKVAWYENMGGPTCDWLSFGPYTVCQQSELNKSRPGAKRLEFDRCKSFCAEDKKCSGFDYDFGGNSCRVWTEPIGYSAKLHAKAAASVRQCYICARETHTAE